MIIAESYHVIHRKKFQYFLQLIIFKDWWLGFKRGLTSIVIIIYILLLFSVISLVFFWSSTEWLGLKRGRDMEGSSTGDYIFIYSTPHFHDVISHTYMRASSFGRFYIHVFLFFFSFFLILWYNTTWYGHYIYIYIYNMQTIWYKL